jgi:hypothetical protein
MLQYQRHDGRAGPNKLWVFLVRTCGSQGIIRLENPRLETDTIACIPSSRFTRSSNLHNLIEYGHITGSKKRFLNSPDPAVSHSTEPQDRPVVSEEVESLSGD